MLRPMFILTICCVVSFVQGACFWGVSAPPTDSCQKSNYDSYWYCPAGQFRTDGGETFCEYEGYKFRNGSSFQTPDCYDCGCNVGTLRCCGFGAALMTVRRLPPECEWQVDGCEARSVRKSDHTMECFSTHSPLTGLFKK